MKRPGPSPILAPVFAAARAAAAAAAILATFLVAFVANGCASSGNFASGSADMFANAPPDVRTKVVTIEVTCRRGRLVADNATITALERMPGVYAVRRGTERNVVLLLVEEFARPESFGERLAPDCTGRVLGVVNQSAPAVSQP